MVIKETDKGEKGGIKGNNANAVRFEKLGCLGAGTENVVFW